MQKLLQVFLASMLCLIIGKPMAVNAKGNTAPMMACRDYDYVRVTYLETYSTWGTGMEAVNETDTVQITNAEFSRVISNSFGTTSEYIINLLTAATGMMPENTEIRTYTIPVVYKVNVYPHTDYTYKVGTQQVRGRAEWKQISVDCSQERVKTLVYDYSTNETVNWNNLVMPEQPDSLGA